MLFWVFGLPWGVLLGRWCVFQCLAAFVGIGASLGRLWSTFPLLCFCFVWGSLVDFRGLWVAFGGLWRSLGSLGRLWRAFGDLWAALGRLGPTLAARWPKGQTDVFCWYRCWEVREHFGAFWRPVAPLRAFCFLFVLRWR